MSAMRVLASLLTLFLLFVAPRTAAAFCGFYVNGADARLLSRATQVVLMRAGTRTVISMQNAYEGPPQDFAMVVPVPVVLPRDQVKTLPRELFDRVDQLGAPRLVEYWEKDPCAQGIGLGDIGTIGHGSGTGQGFGSGHGRLGGSHVTVEAEFAVGEYEIVILSATDGDALDTWLHDHSYKIPAGAEPYLRPYVQAGMKFFVARVNIEKVVEKDGRAVLSPLRFHYDSERFDLPIRLGLINSANVQDLVVSILSERQRYEAANYPNVTIPTNLDVTEAARGSFGSFYAALFDETVKQRPNTVVTEYAWDAGTCDPCPGPTLSPSDIATLGGDVLPANSGAGGAVGGTPIVRMESTTVTGRLPPEVVQRIVRQSFGQFRLCYEKGLSKAPTLQGRVAVRFVIGRDGSVSTAAAAGGDFPDPEVASCVTRAIHQLSFPQPEGGIVTAIVPIRFTLGLATASRGPTGIVLTRLHLRYAKEALGEDLVFLEVPPITGGREVRGKDGALEKGSVEADVNNFQARYAIRHAWTGAIACEAPRRGIWGGPEGVEPAPGTKAARDLAFVARDVSLASFLTGPLPALGAAPASSTGAPAAASAAPAPSGTSSAAPPPASSAAPPPAGGSCGCRTAPAESGGAAFLWILSLLGLARRRRRPAPPQ
jgi:MYXO-CTERM domain-containing protein